MSYISKLLDNRSISEMLLPYTLKTIPWCPVSFSITAVMHLSELPILLGTRVLMLRDLHSNTLLFYQLLDMSK